MLYVVAVIGGLVLAIYGFIAAVILRAAWEGRREREQATVRNDRVVREALEVAARAWRA